MVKSNSNPVKAGRDLSIEVDQSVGKRNCFPAQSRGQAGEERQLLRSFRLKKGLILNWASEKSLCPVSQLMRESLEEVFLGDPFDVKSKRAAFMKRWMKRAVQLRAEEKQLDASLPSPSHLAQEHEAALWKEIWTCTIDEICQRFPLTGWAQASGVFQTQVKPPDFLLEQLEGMAKGLNIAVVASLERPTGCQWTKSLGWQMDGSQRNLIRTSINSSLPRGFS